MTRWTEQFNDDLNERRLKLTQKAWRQMRGLGLTKLDLILLITNGQWNWRYENVIYRFDHPALGRSTREIGEAAGLADVVVAIDRQRGKVVAVGRNRRLPHVPRAPLAPMWAPTFRLGAAPGALKLTRHAVQQMGRRGVSEHDVAFVIRHGACIHRQGQVYYTLLNRDRDGEQAAQWQRLVGTTVVVCRFTTEVITVWRDRETAHRRLMRKPKERRFRRRAPRFLAQYV